MRTVTSTLIILVLVSFYLSCSDSIDTDATDKLFKIVKIDGKQGYIDYQGNIVIEPMFYYIGEFHNGIAKIKNKKKKQGFVNMKGEIIVEPKFDDVLNFQNINWTGVKEGDSWRFLKRDGTYLNDFSCYFILTEGDISTFRDKASRKMGLINKEGEIIVEPKYDETWLFENGMIGVELNKKWGIVNSKGESVLQPEFEELRKTNIKNGLVYVKKDGKFGIWSNINSDEKSIEFKYDDVFVKRRGDLGNGQILKGFSSAKKGENWFLINNLGQEIYDLGEDNSWRLYRDDIIVIRNQSSRKTSIINLKGELITPFEFDQIIEFTNGCSFAIKDGKYGCINSKGKTIADFKYDYQGSIHEDGFSIAYNRENRYIYDIYDTEGNLIIASQQLRDGISEGLISFKGENSKFGYVNLQGDIAIQPQYEGVRNFKDGLAVVDMNGKQGLINKRNQFVIEPVYQWVDNIQDGYYRVGKRGSFGLCNQSGDLILEQKYIEIDSFRNGLARVGIEVVKRPYSFIYGYVNENGKMIYRDTSKAKFNINIGG